MKYLLFALALVATPALAYRPPNFTVREVLWDIFVLAVVAVCFGLADYAIQKAPFISDPIKSFIHWALIVVAVIILIVILLGIVGL